MKSGENELIGPGDNDYGRKDDHKEPYHSLKYIHTDDIKKPDTEILRKALEEMEKKQEKSPWERMKEHTEEEEDSWDNKYGHDKEDTTVDWEEGLHITIPPDTEVKIIEDEQTPQQKEEGI